MEFKGDKVSIHTPTQGVTSLDDDDINGLKVSIHTPTQGVTFRQGYNILLQSFNPHTHAGCDIEPKGIMFFWDVSIHTPTQGVTVVEWFTGVFDMFQSTHPRRV